MLCAGGDSSGDQTESNVYAPDNSRLSITGTATANATYLLLNDTSSQPIVEYRNNSPYYSRAWGPGIDELLGEYWHEGRDDLDRRYYVLHDALGSVTAIADSSGAVQSRQSYRPFGSASRTSELPTSRRPVRFGFTNRESSAAT